MSKITNDGLTRSVTGCFIAVYPYGNSGRQGVNTVVVWSRSTAWRSKSRSLASNLSTTWWQASAWVLLQAYNCS